MKFYIDKKIIYYWDKILNNNLTAIYDNSFAIRFYKNGKYHNSKNASYISNNGYKSFYLNGKYYGKLNKFTKQSWRKFVKLKVFL
jgi:hypothetical protein